MVKDNDHEWGEFVRLRLHLGEALPRQLAKGSISLGKGKRIDIDKARLVIGTMTDPYQPAEAKHKITRTALEILTNPNTPQFQKVGIFTRSPLVTRDIDLIAKLPQARVHFTITPYPHDVMRVLEPYSARTEVRWKIVKELKDAGLRVHVNVAPVMPQMSEQFVDEFTQRLAELKVDEFFWDPMQPYESSFDAFKAACQQTNLDWPTIETIMSDKGRYLEWKADHMAKLQTAWDQVKHLSPDTMAIWSDHEHRVWYNLGTGEHMSRRNYGT